MFVAVLIRSPALLPNLTYNGTKYQRLPIVFLWFSKSQISQQTTMRASLPAARANYAVGRGSIHSIGFSLHPNRIRNRWFHHNIMTLSNIAATAGKRAARYGYRNHRHLVPTLKRHDELNGIHSNPKMNGERTVIGPRGVPPISICVKGTLHCV